MNCPVCRQGETRPGTTTVLLQRGGATVVINDVPARVCGSRGEEHVDEQVAAKVLATAEALARAGVSVEIRDYVARDSGRARARHGQTNPTRAAGLLAHAHAWDNALRGIRTNPKPIRLKTEGAPAAASG